VVGTFEDLEKPSDPVSEASAAVADAMALQEHMRRHQALLASGAPGTATIKHFTDTGTLVNFNPEVILDLSVAVDGQDAYDAQLTTSVPQVHLSRLAPGGSVAVRVDPTDPTTIAIDWTA
jgi:hypothetical protein